MWTLNNNACLVDDLLGWYDRNARKLPWRVSPAERKAGLLPDPYHVWLSEVMLQQTTVATVTSYYGRFLAKWPTIEELASTDEEEILKAWAGLGYYSRARNLKKCANRVAEKFGGRFPVRYEELLELPGIGDYTAAAILTIAYDRVAPVVDGNIERVVSRLCCIEIPLPKSRPVIREFMSELVPNKRCGDFVQAMMDLGASICSPKSPDCSQCPIATHCKASLSDSADQWPRKASKKPKPERVGAAFVAVAPDGSVLLRKRKEKGLLAGMSEVPTSGWTARIDGETGIGAAPFTARWQACGTIRHTFTHFHLVLNVFRNDCDGQIETNGWWSHDVTEEALPTVFRKAIAKAGL